MNRINLSVCQTGTLRAQNILDGRLIVTWLLGISIIFGAMNANAQRNLTLYNMKGIPQTTFLNPAFLHNGKWFIGAAGGSSWSNTGFTFKEMGIQKPLRFAAPDAMYTMASTYADANNYTNGDATVHYFNGGYRQGDNFFTLNITDHWESDQNSSSVSTHS